MTLTGTVGRNILEGSLLRELRSKKGGWNSGCEMLCVYECL